MGNRGVRKLLSTYCGIVGKSQNRSQLAHADGRDQTYGTSV